MKRMVFLVLLFMLVSFPGLSQDDLQKTLAGAGGAKDFPNAPYLVVSDRTMVRVEESGLSHVDKEMFYKVLNAEGAKTLQSLTFGYDPLSAYVEVREMKVIRPLVRGQRLSRPGQGHLLGSAGDHHPGRPPGTR
jgi:hypothetical protein